MGETIAKRRWLIGLVTLIAALAMAGGGASAQPAVPAQRHDVSLNQTTVFTDPQGNQETMLLKQSFTVLQETKEETDERITFQLTIQDFMIETTREGRSGQVKVEEPYTVTLTVYTDGRVEVQGDTHGLFTDIHGSMANIGAFAPIKKVSSGDSWNQTGLLELKSYGLSVPVTTSYRMATDLEARFESVGKAQGTFMDKQLEVRYSARGQEVFDQQIRDVGRHEMESTLVANLTDGSSMSCRTQIIRKTVAR